MKSTTLLMPLLLALVMASSTLAQQGKPQPSHRFIRLVQTDLTDDFLDRLAPETSDTDQLDSLFDEAEDLTSEEDEPDVRGDQPSDRTLPPFLQNDQPEPLDQPPPSPSAGLPHSPGDAATTDEGFNYDYTEPVPEPIYERRPRRQQPYTLAGILDDDEQDNRWREEEYCRQIWECAGGRQQRACQRYMRNFRRNRQVIWGGRFAADPYNPMENFSAADGGSYGNQTPYSEPTTAYPPYGAPVETVQEFELGDNARDAVETLPSVGVPDVMAP